MILDEIPKLRLLGPRILVRRSKHDEMTAGGIVIPDNAKDPPLRGEVVKVGPGRWLDDGTRAPLKVAVGEHVFFARYAATRLLPLTDSDDDYIVLYDEDCMLAFEDKDTVIA